jgi:hypothetical protein
MATQELVLANQTIPQQPDRIKDVQRLGGLISASGYFSDAKEMAQAAVKVMAGEELGIAPVAAMMGINIIKGKVALSANLMAALVRRSGYNYRIKSMDNNGCVITFIGRDGQPIGESSFTAEDAKAAEIKGDMYKKYPRNMYFSRAMSNGVRWYCPEITSGIVAYTPEEMGAQVDSEGEMIQAETLGSQDAADAVAARKIAEHHNFKMMRAFRKMRESIGDQAYYKILGAHGYEHCNTSLTGQSRRAFTRN